MSVSEFPGRAVGTPIEPPSALPEGSCMPQLDIVGLSRICFCPRIKGWINQTLLSPLPSVFALWTSASLCALSASATIGAI